MKDESSTVMTHIGATATEYTMKHFAPLAPHWESERDRGCAFSQLAWLLIPAQLYYTCLWPLANSATTILSLRHKGCVKC